MLNSPNISYLLITPLNLRDTYSYLSTKNYNISVLKEYKNTLHDCIIASCSVDNNDLRKDALHLLNHFNEKELFIKYLDTDKIYLLDKNGSENPFTLTTDYNKCNENYYIIDTNIFGLISEKRYFYPTKKEEFKNGLILEYFNNNVWNTKEVKNSDEEYDKMYKVLSKYKKVRISI